MVLSKLIEKFWPSDSTSIDDEIEIINGRIVDKTIKNDEEQLKIKN
ncbi:hypothetical protein [Halonatronum saccharophilum]|nr:hypothetical protein [Halonatronum saccharophilum]